MAEIPTVSPLQDAVDRVARGEDRLDLSVQATPGRVAVGVEGEKDLGRPGGWSLGGAVQYVKEQTRRGLEAIGFVRWRPK